MSENTAPGLLGSLRRLLGDLVAVAHTRLALLVNEIEEEKIRFSRVLVNSFLALASLVVGAVLLVLFFVLLFWEHRLFIVGGASLLFVAMALVFAGRSRAGLEKRSGLFRTSLAELEADVNSLKGTGGKDESPSA